jgi:hypothetical protein
LPTTTAKSLHNLGSSLRWQHRDLSNGTVD